TMTEPDGNGGLADKPALAVRSGQGVTHAPEQGHHNRGRMARSGARPSTGPEKRSAPRAGQRLAGAVARRWRPPARSRRGRDRRYWARLSVFSVERVLLGAGERATR